MEDKKWFILWSNSKRNLKAFEVSFVNYNVEIWNPCFKQVDREGEEEMLSLFPGYFFVYCTFLTALHIENNCRELGYYSTKFLKDSTGKPVPLTDKDIDNIKELEMREVVVESNFKQNQKVFIKGGPLGNMECEVLETKGGNVKVRVRLFQREVDLWVKECNCMKIEK